MAIHFVPTVSFYFPTPAFTGDG